MTMYKPGTQLIITELWAAAAHKLGFNVEISATHNGKTLTWGWEEYLSDNLYFNLLYPDDDCKIKVFITVTESGPNAAERFLPQLGDTVLAWCYPDADPQPPAMEVVHRLGDNDDDWCTFDVTPDGSQIKRIIERDGIPFPQFSEVIEP